MNDKIQNSSSIQGRDEEIASLQAELALHHDQEQRLKQLEKELEDNHQENNKADQLEEMEASLADKQKENAEKSSNIKNLEDDLLLVKDQYRSAVENIVDCNGQISNLKSELEKRNDEIVGFIKMLKKIKESLRTQGSPDYMINGDVFDIDTTEMSWDHGFDIVLEPAKDLIEKLVEDNLEKSKLLDDQSQQDKDAQICYLDTRCSDLEAILTEKQHQLADMKQVENSVEDLKGKLEESEKELLQMQTYLNSKLAEMKEMRLEMSAQKETNIENKEQLQKACSAIQGFISENFRLSEDLKSVTAERDGLLREKQSNVRSDDVLCLENERLRAEVEALSTQNLEATAKTKYMQKGIDKARENFESKLGDYREKFDCVVAWWKAGKEACELMRVRLEELADFLQQLLDMEENGGDLNMSSISMDLRESLQRSIDESRLLSASILASQTSMIQEMSMVGLQVGEEDQIYELDEEKWIVPEVEASIFDASDALALAEDTVAKTEYDTLLLELRDNLRKRRVAEEELEKMKERFSQIEEDVNQEKNADVSKFDTGVEKLQAGSKIPVASRGRSTVTSDQNKTEARKAKSVDGRRRSSSRPNRTTEAVDGHQRRQTLTRIPGPCPGEEDDCWSEPDKEESRRRIGLESDLSGTMGHARDGGQSHRTTDDEIVGGELGTELRRERGRVERLRGELLTGEKREKALQNELAATKQELVLCTENQEMFKLEEKTNRGRLEKIRSETQELERENVKLIKELEHASQLEKEKQELERKVKDDYEVIEKLKSGIQSWEEECKNMKLELDKKDVEDAIQKEIATKNQEIERLADGLNRYEAKCKQMIDQFNGLTEEVKKWKSEAESKEKEFSNAKEEVNILNEDVKKYESYCDKIKEEYELLQIEVAKWKGLAIEKKKSEDLTNLVTKYEAEMDKIRTKSERRKSEVEKLRSVNSRQEEKCKNLEDLSKENDSKLLELEEKVRNLTYEMERKDMAITKKSENLDEAETLLKELNERKKDLKKNLGCVRDELGEKKNELQQLKNLYEEYKRNHNDEITQNKVNEIEIKMKNQADAMKKFAEEIIKVEGEKKVLEAKQKENQSIMKTAEKKIKNMTDCLEQEKYNGNELGKTIDHLRKSVHKLETEKMLKESLEIEFKNLQEAHQCEKEITKNLNERIDKLEKSKKLTEDRCHSAEEVLKTLSADSFAIDKENQKSNLSKLELETVLQHSRPASRRRGLSSVDQNTSSTAPFLFTSVCCSHLADLNQVKLERDAALAKLNSTRSSLASTAEKLSVSNKRKKQVEKAICQQLTKTHEVLRKTKTNLENANGGKN